MRRAKTGTHHQEQTADCSKSHHAGHSPCIGRLRFRSRLRVFAASREPNSPQRPPLHALRGRGYRGGTGDTAPGIPPDQPRWLLPCSEIRNSSREDAKTRSGGHTIVRREAGNTAPKAGDTPSRSRLQTASKSHHAGHSPCIGRLRFRSRLRGFAASREPNSPQRRRSRGHTTVPPNSRNQGTLH